jgi:hypothetical protein
MWFGWPIVFAIIYFLGVCMGVICVQAEWQPQAAGDITLLFPPGYRLSAGGLGTYPWRPRLPLNSVPALTVPICGCITVLVGLGLILSIRWAFAAANGGADKN